MADVYVRLANGPIARTMYSEEGDVRCDIGDDGLLLGVEISGVIAVTIDGRVFDSESGGE